MCNDVITSYGGRCLSMPIEHTRDVTVLRFALPSNVTADDVCLVTELLIVCNLHNNCF